MDAEELENDIQMQKWKTLLYASSNSPERYWRTCTRSMTYFTEMIEKTPVQLIADAKAEIREGRFDDEKELTYLIPKYKTYLENNKHIKKGTKRSKLSENSVRLYIAVIKSFYEYHYIQIPKTKGKSQKVRTKKENDKIPEIDEIRAFLKHCNTLERALVLCAISGGLGSAELCSLKMGDYREGYDPETQITTLLVDRDKAGTRFITFLNPEASRAVNEYLKERDKEPLYNTPDYIDGAKKTRTTDDSYLFIQGKITEDYLTTGDEELRKLDEDGIRARYRKVNKKAQMNTRSGSYNHVRAHTVRKIFNNTLKLKGCNNTVVEYMMGHTVDTTQAAYFFKAESITPETIQLLRDNYVKYYPDLLVESDYDVTESPEYLKLVEDNEVLSKVHACTVVKLDKMSSLEQRMEQMQKEMSEVTKIVAKHPKLANVLFDDDES
jgi:integrase